VFIALGGIQIVATALIMLCAARYKDMSCPVHLPGQPTAETATGTETRGNEAGSPCRWRPACPGCSPRVMCAADRSTGSRPRSAKARPSYP
jgi:hypothetical protein